MQFGGVPGSSQLVMMGPEQGHRGGGKGGRGGGQEHHSRNNVGL